MKIGLLFVLVSALLAPREADRPRQDPQSGATTAALQATYEEWIRAWNQRDVKAISAIAFGAFGFGRDVPFARAAAASSASYEEGLEAYFENMAHVSYEGINTQYKVLGDTGLVWGHYAQTTKQLTGPSRTVYGRHSLTFMFRDGRWRMVFYHRSMLPNEFIR